MHVVKLNLPPPVRVPDWMNQVLLTELTVELAPRAPWRLPEDPDGMLRGVLGNAMFDLCCARPHRQCDGCDLRTDCDMPGWYDPGRPHAHAPRPVIARSQTEGGAVVDAGAPWRAQLQVLGAAPRDSLLVEALVRMARNGLGPERAPHRLIRLEARGAGEPVTVIRDERAVGIWPDPGTLASFAPLPYRPDGVEIRVRTPLRWTGAAPHRWPTAGELIWAALGRVRQVLRAQGLPQPPPWPEPRELETPWAEARWVDDARQPSGAGRHDLSGWVGRVALGPEAIHWADLLVAGALLGTGQSISAGRGRLDLRWR